MTEFQRVIDFGVSGHVLRSIADSCRHNLELRTRQSISCMTSTTDHVETKHGHHELVCELRDVVELFTAPHSSQHLHDRLSSKWRVLRLRWNSLWTSTSRSWFHQESWPATCRFLAACVRWCRWCWPRPSGCPCPKLALVSIAHLQDHVDASVNSARNSGAVRSSARCWHVSGLDASHHATTRSATMCGWHDHPICGSMASRVCFSWAIVEDTSWHVNSQDHGRSQMYMFRQLNNCVSKNTQAESRQQEDWFTRQTSATAFL